MKIVSCVLGVFLLLGQAQAGLFEYTLGESTHINASSKESADAIETLDYNKSQIHTSNTTKSYYFSEDTVAGVESEMKHLLDIAGQMRLDISKMKNYSSRPYVVLRSQLQKDLRNIQDRINYLSDRKRDLMQRNGYYDYRKLSHRNTRFYSARAQDYYRKYNYSYNDYNYGYYTYDSHNNYYTRKPHWLNPNLKERSQGYIYIK